MKIYEFFIKFYLLLFELLATFFFSGVGEVQEQGVSARSRSFLLRWLNNAVPVSLRHMKKEG